MIKDVLTIRTKFKNLVAQQVYNKKWNELSATQQNELQSKHRQQFYILSRRVRKEMSNKTTPNHHDLLIEMNIILKELKKDFDNHLAHHFRYNILACSVALGAIVTLAIALIKVL